MASKADEMIDRRRLRRKLTFWRVVAFLVLAGVIAGSAYWMAGDRAGSALPHIARVEISGTITDDKELQERLERIRESDAVQGVIIAVNSPGGTTTGGEAIFEAVRKLAEEKPVVAQVGTLAASAGYMIATAADHIVARQSSIVGSIGVLVQYPDVTGLMEKIGVQLEGVKSSPLKAEPSPFSPTTEEERAMLRRLVMDSYDWFVDLVDERRPMTRAQVLAVADGSIFTGRQALERQMVDALGGDEVVIAWLEERGVAEDLEIVDWRARSSGVSLLGLNSWTAIAARLLGLPDDDVLRTIGADRMFLDGLQSVWQPNLNVGRD
jgi:protease IV